MMVSILLACMAFGFMAADRWVSDTAADDPVPVDPRFLLTVVGLAYFGALFVFRS